LRCKLHARRAHAHPRASARLQLRSFWPLPCTYPALKLVPPSAYPVATLRLPLCDLAHRLADPRQQLLHQLELECRLCLKRAFITGIGGPCGEPTAELRTERVQQLRPEVGDD